jgi:prolyl oligopeptidase
MTALCVACGAAPRPLPAGPAPVTSVQGASGARGPSAAHADDARAGKRQGPPVADKRPVTHTYFGTTVSDDYEWLEDGKSPEVRAFTDAENAYARKALDALPDRPAIKKRITELLGQSSSDYWDVRDVAHTLFVLKEAPPKQQPMLVTRSESADPASEHVVVDPNSLDPSGGTTIDFYAPSPDGKLVAVSLSKGGSESGDVHVFEVASGKPRPDVVLRVNGGTAGGSVAWNADGSGFYYTRYPRAGERPEADLDFYQQVWLHKLGAAEDTYSMGKDLPRIAEIALARSDDGKSILAVVSNGDGGEVEHHVLVGGQWKRLSRFEDELSVASFGADGKVYAIARKGAPRGKVVAFAPPFDKPAEEIIPQGDSVIEALAATKTALYTVELLGGPSRVRRFPLGVTKAEPLAREAPRPTKHKKHGKSGTKGTPAREAPRPPPTTIAPGARGLASAELPILPVSNVSAIERIGEDLLVRNESFVEPPAWYRYRASEDRLVKTPMAKTAPADMSDVEVVRESCVSKDGTKVPMSILRRKGTKLTRDLPTLLTGYGGYGVSRKPRLRPWQRLWLDQGGVIADANLRGGSELGEEWHRAGKLTHKQNVFDDFAACAKGLFDLGYTSPEHLAITGRSNGGLLMSASLVQHPEMFRAVVAAVGIHDMLRVELTPNGAFNVTEYGTVKDEADFRAMLAYSPLHNVRDGVAYPAVLFTTGANDPRVDPFHSRKMVARLQAATSSDRPILLRSSGDTGHGIGTPLAAEIDQETDELAFLLHELGVHVH